MSISSKQLQLLAPGRATFFYLERTQVMDMRPQPVALERQSQLDVRHQAQASLVSLGRDGVPGEEKSSNLAPAVFSHFTTLTSHFMTE